MSKAEERALDAYDTNTPAPIRIAYRDGYEQAEKDLALTWEDVQDLWIKTQEYMAELKRVKLEKFPSSSRELFEEVLRRYQSTKNKDND